VLTAAEESAKGLASAAAAAQRIIAEVADDFDISKIFINVTLSTETAVPSDITLNVFGAELVVPGFSLDFKAAIDQKLEPLDALVDDLAAKAAEAAEQLFTETIPGWVETAAAGIDSVVVGPVQQEIEKLKAELEASLGAERYSEGLQVSAGASFCQVDANNCVSDGTGNHGDNEACTINVLGAGTLTATDFNTEPGYDYVTIGGTRYSGGTGPSDVAVAAGSTFTWRSDSSITRAGFTICWWQPPPAYWRWVAAGRPPLPPGTGGSSAADEQVSNNQRLDSTSWRYKGKSAKDCNWVARAPTDLKRRRRCLLKNSSGKRAVNECKAACK